MPMQQILKQEAIWGAKWIGRKLVFYRVSRRSRGHALLTPFWDRGGRNRSLGVKKLIAFCKEKKRKEEGDDADADAEEEEGVAGCGARDKDCGSASKNSNAATLRFFSHSSSTVDKTKLFFFSK